MSERNKALAGIYSSSLGKLTDVSRAAQMGQVYRTGTNSFNYVDNNGAQKNMTLAQVRDLAENVELIGTKAACESGLALIEAERLMKDSERLMAKISDV